MSTSLSATTEVSVADWRAWVAEAAYYRAQSRGFQGGSPLDDWLNAERELRQKLAPSISPPRIALVFLDRC